MIAALTGLLGAAVGSFLNVVIFRVPQRRSVIAPRSACGSCGSAIRPWDNVPIVSWLVLRGRCRDCSAAISLRYPLVELGTAVFFCGVAIWALANFEPATLHDWLATITVLAAFLYLAAVSIALTAIDLETSLLPNVIVLPSYVVAAVLLTAAALIVGDPARLLTAAAGGAILFVAYLLMALLYPGGMGLGDVKLAGVLGIYLGWLGWEELAVGSFAAFLLGGLFSVILVVVRRAGRRTAIPFGPWMLVGAWVGIFAGAPVFSGYLALFGLQ
ncbi:A24 family peptidase [Cryobacterium sp. BB307]|uniref:prepilin peptidase n=1 Tax=Cryobacterium sp. BB307 TaxID=2716317 RepID=UPI0014473DEA